MRTSNTSIRSTATLAAASVLLASCAAVPRSASPQTPPTEPAGSEYWDSVVTAWEGEKAIDLWRSWGVPTKIVTAPNGNEMHIYLSSAQTKRDGSPIYLSHGVAAAPEGSGCETDFEVSADKIIVNSLWRGDSCPRSEKQSLPKWIFIPFGF